MQFKLAQTYRYWWPVTVRVPDLENAGQIVEQRLRVQLEPMPQDEYDATLAETATLLTARELTAHGIKSIQRVVRNWDGVIDGNGEPVEFSEDMLSQALQYSWFRIGIQKALQESQNGEAARLGN